MKKKTPIINEEQITITSNLNNLKAGDSVNEHRMFERGNITQAEDEIKQQNNNL
ncbi:hypothetical protein ACFFF5_09375 [Lederbergia wuyishanensis]|uniref:Uncharacterized protein n=1 Tax=Lederbergia wuyishanensis TaxID=1347903 RepID=A0ABU0D7T4_9BACI|nr:hypothetical protein [Lederbergia wuyishanensis]MCJ8009104.1 hypothetical protein [Lederbergia wuyishanensis]MDQ0344442.1 hypothetical protein [Lederbergia wuyishanensis]